MEVKNTDTVSSSNIKEKNSQYKQGNPGANNINVRSDGHYSKDAENSHISGLNDEKYATPLKPSTKAKEVSGPAYSNIIDNNTSIGTEATSITTSPDLYSDGVSFIVNKAMYSGEAVIIGTFDASNFANMIQRLYSKNEDINLTLGELSSLASWSRDNYLSEDSNLSGVYGTVSDTLNTANTKIQSTMEEILNLLDIYMRETIINEQATENDISEELDNINKIYFIISGIN